MSLSHALTTAPTSPRLVSTETAAVYAGCSRSTIVRRLRSGELTEHRFGPRTIRVDLNELDNLASIKLANASEIDGYISDLVSGWPPLTAEQKERLALLLLRST